MTGALVGAYDAKGRLLAWDYYGGSWYLDDAFVNAETVSMHGIARGVAKTLVAFTYAGRLLGTAPLNRELAVEVRGTIVLPAGEWQIGVIANKPSPVDPSDAWAQLRRRSFR